MPPPSPPAPLWQPGAVTQRQLLAPDLAVLGVEVTPRVAQSQRAPGQYMAVKTPEGEGLLALTNAPGQALQWLVAGGSPMADWLLGAPLPAGLMLSPAQGPGFDLAGIGRDTPVLVAATGSGVGPLRPVWRTLVAQGVRPHILHGARTWDHLAFADELSQLDQDKLAHVGMYVSAGAVPANPRVHAGRITAALSELNLDRPRAMALLCGVPQMVAEVSHWLQAGGTPARNIRINH